MQACRQLERARAEHHLHADLFRKTRARYTTSVLRKKTLHPNKSQRSDTLGIFVSFSDLTHNVLSATGSPRTAIDAAMHHA